jgi:heme exporter protein D
MIEQLSTIIHMDGNGLYVWSCFLILILIICINIYMPTRKLKKVHKEGQSKTQ